MSSSRRTPPGSSSLWFRTPPSLRAARCRSATARMRSRYAARSLAERPARASRTPARGRPPFDLELSESVKVPRTNDSASPRPDGSPRPLTRIAALGLSRTWASTKDLVTSTGENVSSSWIRRATVRMRSNLLWRASACATKSAKVVAPPLVLVVVVPPRRRFETVPRWRLRRASSRFCAALERRSRIWHARVAAFLEIEDRSSWRSPSLFKRVWKALAAS
mmetsp:Transcript_24185/g.74583  ORF Transcript_24185/g.74583 Transcript_24185/m.74583 type:complete len:221 (-) Transcript_24185:960-1622(-)